MQYATAAREYVAARRSRPALGACFYDPEHKKADPAAVADPVVTPPLHRLGAAAAAGAADERLAAAVRRNARPRLPNKPYDIDVQKKYACDAAAGVGSAARAPRATECRAGCDLTLRVLGKCNHEGQHSYGPHAVSLKQTANLPDRLARAPPAGSHWQQWPWVMGLFERLGRAPSCATPKSSRQPRRLAPTNCAITSLRPTGLVFCPTAGASGGWVQP